MYEQIQRYADGHKLIRTTLANLDNSGFLYKPSSKQWSIKEIIIHVCDAEIVGIHRMKKVLSEFNPFLTAFDQDLWMERGHYPDLDDQVHLRLFQSLRESFVPVLRLLKEEDWNRTGIHMEAGRMSLKDILNAYIKHVDDHVRQIQRVRESYNSAK